jgi:tetratricopeptide (TPR) repeat protein
MRKKVTLSTLFIWVFSFVVILSLNFNAYGEKVVAVKIAMPNETIELYKPITIINESHYLDGGSSKYTVRDNRGKDFDIFIDKSITNEMQGKPHYISIGGINIPKEQEKVIYDMLDNCVNSIQPNDYRGYVGRGERNQSRGELDQAIADYSKAIEINPNYDYAYYIRAHTYLYYIKDYNKAWADVRKAQELGYKFDSRFLWDLKKASGGEN